MGKLPCIPKTTEESTDKGFEHTFQELNIEQGDFHAKQDYQISLQICQVHIKTMKFLAGSVENQTK